jgi:nucleotide-binding universal stress UspA family protein
MLEASHVEDLEAERTRAPARVQRARDCLASISGVKVHESIVEGDPEHVILAEADRLQADLIVLGSHGYGPIKRRLLGSVSQAVALHAPCSVEIVRCREASAAGTAGADG